MLADLLRRPYVVALTCTSLAVGVVCVPAHAFAQDETEESSEQSSEEDLQSQVGVGTEKEEVEVKTDEAKATPTIGDEPKAEEETYGHQGQFGLRLGLGLGYKVLIRADDSPPCDIDGDGDSESVCAYNTPGAFDLAASFAVFDSIEPYVWLRMGLGEDDTTQTAAVQLFGAGLRVYTMSDAQLKLFFEPALAIEVEGATDAAPTDATYDTDFVIHGHFGLQYDFMAYLGLYASIGPNVSFVRAIGTELEGSIGIQGRAP
jgi:hypothetical protein